MIKIGDINVMDFYRCDSSCKFLKDGVCISNDEKLYEYDKEKNFWYRTDSCKENNILIMKPMKCVYNNDEFIKVDGDITLYDFFDFVRKCDFGDNDILIVLFKNGNTKIFAKANVLGGVCDDCTCDEMDELVDSYIVNRMVNKDY